MNNRLREARESRSMTVTELARRSGVSRQTIYSIEADPSYAPLGSVMARLAEALGEDLGAIFTSKAVA